jgi:hypothetical protein
MVAQHRGTTPRKRKHPTHAPANQHRAQAFVTHRSFDDAFDEASAPPSTQPASSFESHGTVRLRSGVPLTQQPPSGCRAEASDGTLFRGRGNQQRVTAPDTAGSARNHTPPPPPLLLAPKSNLTRTVLPVPDHFVVMGLEASTLSPLGSGQHGLTRSGFCWA